MAAPAICPTCNLSPAPFADMVHALDVIAASLARLEVAGHLTRKQRLEWKFSTAAIGEMRQLIQEEVDRQAAAKKD